MEKLKQKKKVDYREEYFIQKLGIPMNDFFTQVSECMEQKKDVVVKGFGFNATDLGILKSEEAEIVQEIRERAPDF